MEMSNDNLQMVLPAPPMEASSTEIDRINLWGPGGLARACLCDKEFRQGVRGELAKKGLLPRFSRDQGAAVIAKNLEEYRTSSK